MTRYFQHSNTRHSNNGIYLIGLLTLVVLLSGVLLFFTNEKQQEQVLYSYCGDFGFYGKVLVLMKNKTFKFSYYGCSQANGYVQGTWEAKGTTLLFTSQEADGLLDAQYQLNETELIPMNQSIEDKFTLCANYKSPWESTPAGSFDQ